VLNILSSFPPRNNFYVRPDTVPTTTNAHTLCEWDFLQALLESYVQHGKHWPRTWFIYEDNTSHDNKNNFRQWWLSLLVKAGIFDTIIVIYFDVGAH